MSARAIDAILFDMNGVLIDDEALHERAFASTLASIGIELNHDDYLQHFAGMTDAGGFQSIATALDRPLDIDALVRVKMEQYFALAVTDLHGFPDVAATLHALKHEDGLQLAIVTSSTKEEADLVVRTLGIGDVLSAFVTNEDVQRHKPDPQAYQLGAERLGVPIAHCMIVEDSPVGVRAGLASGGKTVAVAQTHPAELLQEADVVLPALTLKGLRAELHHD